MDYKELEVVVSPAEIGRFLAAKFPSSQKPLVACDIVCTPYFRRSKHRLEPLRSVIRLNYWEWRYVPDLMPCIFFISIFPSRAELKAD